MTIIVRPRRGGKTWNIVKDWSASGGYLIVASEVERQRIINKYHPLTKGKENKILVFDRNIREHLAGRPWAPVYIDNLDWLLAMFLGRGEVKEVSINMPVFIDRSGS